MKANKALKRLSKINGLLSELTERFSAKDPHVREVFKDLKAALRRVKEAVTAESSSSRSQKKKGVVDKAARASKPIARANNKNAIQQSALKTRTAQSAQPAKTTARKSAPTRKPPATEPAAQELMHAAR